MAPGTNAGAAHPVTIGPAGESAEIEKATNDWDAASPEPLPWGARVRIVGLHGAHLDVRGAEDAPAR